tara:strand:+ start:1350 stop:1478 length:129 start_codon:yes stop_codon:yes gene_type:complete
MDLSELVKLVEDLYWEYDRMSADGKESLDKIAYILDIKEEED